MNLQDLLRAHDNPPQALPEQATITQPVPQPLDIASATDPLSEHEILITLHLSAAPTFAQRQVLGAVGISGHTPLFIQTAIGVANIDSAIQTLYEQLTPPPKLAVPIGNGAAAKSKSEEIATAKAEPAASSALDIF